MSVVLLLAAVAILAAVVVVASGRGGEMAREHADYAPIDLGPVTAADVALLRPPAALWGYNVRFTDEALDRIARALTQRDVQIAALQRQVDDLRAAAPGEPAGSAARPTARQLAPPDSSPGAAPTPRQGSAVPVRTPRRSRDFAAPATTGRDDTREQDRPRDHGDTKPFPGVGGHDDADGPTRYDHPDAWWEEASRHGPEPGYRQDRDRPPGPTPPPGPTERTRQERPGD